MKKLKVLKGISVFHTPFIRGAVCLPGLGIYMNEDLYHPNIINHVICHEYGHYLDYKYASDLKPFRLLQFYLKIGLPSLVSASTKAFGPHRTFWTELRANRMVVKHAPGLIQPGFEKHFPLKK